MFSVPTGQKVYQFRRGTYPARIYSISFNLASTLLAVSSDTDTIHIYKLEEDKKCVLCFDIEGVDKGSFG